MLRYRSRLSRQVHRHSGLSTLFRSLSDEPSAERRPDAGAAAGEPGVGRSAPITHGVLMRALTSSPAALGTAERPEEKEPALPRPSVPRPVEPALSAELPPRPRAVASSGTREAIEPETATPVVPPADSGDSTLTDAVWRRLQTIFRRHQEQRAGGAPTPMTGEPEAEKTAPSLPAVGAVQREKAEETTAPVIAEATAEQTANETGKLLSPAGAPASQTRRADADTPQSGLTAEQRAPEPPEAIPLPTRTGPRTASEPVAALPLAARVEAAEIMPAASGEHAPIDPSAATPPEAGPSEIADGLSSEMTAAKPPAPMEQLSAPAPIRERVPSAQVDKSDESTEAAPREAQLRSAEERADTPEISTAALPLQAVWAVERVAGPATEVAPGPVETPGHTAPAREAEPPPQTSAVQKALEKVEAARPTDSSIELIAPRRPRPEVEQRPGRRRLPPIATAAPEPAPELLRGPEAEEAEREKVVETAIGPLPADLWTLIGEQAPEAPAPVRTERSPAKGDRDVTQLHLQPLAAPQAVSPVPASPAPKVVQRDAADSSAAAPPPRAQAGSAAGSTEGEINLDELARKVYGEVKRRLSIEWERLRPR